LSRWALFLNVSAALVRGSDRAFISSVSGHEIASAPQITRRNTSVIQLWRSEHASLRIIAESCSADGDGFAGRRRRTAKRRASHFLSTNLWNHGHPAVHGRLGLQKRRYS